MSRRAALVVGRVRSPYDTIHLLTTRVRAGLRLTLCGQYVDRGWRRSPREASCRSCRNLQAGHPLFKKVDAA